MVLSRQPAKTQFTELEAAAELGISVEQLRSLIRNLVNDQESEQSDFAIAQLQPADLLLLKMVSSTNPSHPG